MLGQTGISQTLVITQLGPVCTAHLLASASVGILHALSLLVFGWHDLPRSWLHCSSSCFSCWRKEGQPDFTKLPLFMVHLIHESLVMLMSGLPLTEYVEDNAK